MSQRELMMQYVHFPVYMTASSPFTLGCSTQTQHQKIMSWVSKESREYNKTATSRNALLLLLLLLYRLITNDMSNYINWQETATQKLSARHCKEQHRKFFFFTHMCKSNFNSCHYSTALTPDSDSTEKSVLCWGFSK
jgi:hypothetical protein